MRYVYFYNARSTKPGVITVWTGLCNIDAKICTDEIWGKFLAWLEANTGLSRAEFEITCLSFLHEVTDDFAGPHDLHAREAHPDYEYTTTAGPRKAFDEHAPDGIGWTRNLARGVNGWERFEYHENAYWMRLKVAK